MEPKPRFKCDTEGCKNYAKTAWCRIDKIFYASHEGFCRKCIRDKGLKPCPGDGCGNLVKKDREVPCLSCYHDAVTNDIFE